jgi:hypothetical protein
MKWRLLERNRWALVVRTYPAALLALLAPVLLVTELAVLATALTSGWARAKLSAVRDALRWIPHLRRERRAIQAQRVVGSGEFAAWLSPDLSSWYLGRAGRIAAARWLLNAYWAAVRAVLALTGA